MSAATYDACLARLLAHEGGYTNHPADPGGPTNFGITITDYRKYVKPGAGAADVKAMQVEEAKRIYRAKYWDAQRCDALPAGVDDCVFDYGVNSGIGRSAKVLQRLCSVTADGRIGAQTLAAAGKRDPAALINAICDERLRFLKLLRTWPVFGKGWGRRVAEVRAFALQLARAAADPGAAPPLPNIMPTPDIQQAGKGVVPLPIPAKIIVQRGGKLATGAAAGGALGWAWIAQHPAESAVIAVGAGLLVGGVVSAINRFHQAQQQAAMPGLVPVPAAA